MTSTSRQSAFSVHFCIPWFLLEVPSKTITPHHTSVLIIQWLTGSVMRACKLLLLFVAATLAISSVTAGTSFGLFQIIKQSIEQRTIYSPIEQSINHKSYQRWWNWKKNLFEGKKTLWDLSEDDNDVVVEDWSKLVTELAGFMVPGTTPEMSTLIVSTATKLYSDLSASVWQIVTSTHQNLTSQLQNRFDTTLGKVIWSAVEGVLRVCRVHELMTIKVL